MTRGFHDLAAALHEGQTDRAGLPYIGHLERVARNSRTLAQAIAVEGLLSEDDVFAIEAAGYLHDAEEDGKTTEEALRAAGVPESSLASLRLLNRNRFPGITYQEWIDRIAESGDIGALLVKISDNRDNSDPVRLASLPEEARGIVNRYRRSLARLLPAVEDWKMARRSDLISMR